MAIVDVVKWEGLSDQLAWKYPSTELGSWTQLIVSETQEAWLLLEGRPIGPYHAGRHTLDLPNYPGLTSLIKVAAGGRTPFSAEVYFVNKAINLNVKWGTSTPMQVQDPKFKIMLPVRAHGQLGLQVLDSSKFLFKLVGTLPSFEQAQFVNYFRGVIVTKSKDTIAKLLTTHGLSVLDLSARLEDISAGLKASLEADLEEFGLGLVNFYVNSIDAPEDDPAVSRLKQALAKRAEMEILGYNYQQERSFDALEAAAGNNGAGGAVLGAGLGLGMGVGMGPAIGAGLGQAATQMNFGGKTACPVCRVPNLPDAAFCSGCGSSMRPAAAQMTCSKCNKLTPIGAFCANCGASTQHKCSKCSAVISSEVKFCPTCGTNTNS